MSLTLDMGTEPIGLTVSHVGGPIMIGNYKLSMRDFIELVIYVMTNTNISDDDPRLKLIDTISRMKKTTGWGEVGERLGVDINDYKFNNLNTIRRNMYDVSTKNGTSVASIFPDDNYIQFYGAFTQLGCEIKELWDLVEKQGFSTNHT